MDSAKNSTEYSKKNEYFSNYCRKQKKEKHFQTLSKKAVLPCYQNQMKGVEDYGSNISDKYSAKVLNKIQTKLRTYQKYHTSEALQGCRDSLMV